MKVQSENCWILAYVSFNTAVAVQAKVKQKITSQFEPVFLKVGFWFSSMYNFVVDSTFDGRRFERGGYQFFGVNKHDVYEITEPNTNLKKKSLSQMYTNIVWPNWNFQLEETK